ncbi:MAG TPA: TraR/DksA C4-type zinc finger protein [Gemmatimonadaceae bacterium]|jgi:RNA polymerase-binding transcription factor DksA|nr:TraR/DksA C4-type zinc finger protein [Gemmatimonadaceae bacterium]
MRKTTFAPDLTRVQLKELQRELQSELARIERTARLDTAHGESDSWASDNGAGGGTAVLDSAIVTMPPSRAAARSAAVREALDRMTRGSYGICMRCAQPIPYARLIAMPETPFCVSCGARA